MDTKENGPPKAWRMQAETIAEMTFATYRDELVHETPAIKRFLEDTRGDQFVISAPRGFGKTLLLLAKSAEVHDRMQTTRFTGAAGQIIDQPTGQFPNLPAIRTDSLKVDSGFWQNLWRVAIQAACVKHHRRVIGEPIVCGELECDPILEDAICNPRIYVSACDFFVLLVGRSEKEQMRIMRRTGTLSAEFNAISSAIVLFIDNVEEYFSPVLEDISQNDSSDKDGTLNPGYYRALSNEIWVIAQCALVSVALVLNEINGHVKIYCTIRHEAFLAIHKYDDRYQKVHGATLQLTYLDDDYKKIFDKNIALMPNSELVEPKSSDPMIRLVGQGNSRIKHKVMRQPQQTFDFILRHTLRRPRDLMLIGQAIADIRPEDRTEGALHHAITQATGPIVNALITEMKPFFPIPDLDNLARLIPKNALTHQEIDAITKEHLTNGKIDPQAGGLDRAPMSVLFCIGLLGILRRNFREMLPHQHFRKPFEVTFEDGAKLPQTEELYLVHPSLDQFTLERSGTRYLHNFEARNIVGDGLPWEEPLKSYFVMKGDVCTFSKFMDSDIYPLLVGRLESWAQTIGEGVFYYELSGGDSVLFVDRNPFRLIDATLRFQDKARKFVDEPVSLRFGGSAGPVLFHTVNRRRNQESYEIDVPLGLPLRHAARIEPLAAPDTIVVDDAFRQRVLEMSNGDHDAQTVSFEPVTADSILLATDPDGRVLVRKGPADPAYPTHLWRVVQSRAE